MRVIFSSILLAGVVLCQGADDNSPCNYFRDLKDAKARCPTHMATAAKCTSTCYEEASFCKDAANIIEMQDCILDIDAAERSDYCNDCIRIKTEEQCEEVYDCFREQESETGSRKASEDDSHVLESFTQFKRFCKTRATPKCTKSGCEMSASGCIAKKKRKVKCSQILEKDVCERISGCSLSKKGDRKRVCKGTPAWVTSTRTKKND